MRKTSSGFTLIEILVATAVFGIFMIGILNLLDTSTRVSVTEASLSDTQENVRFAAYHIMRTARMMGSSLIPFADDSTGTALWVAGELASNVDNTATTPFGSVDVVNGSDVLTLRGFFELAPFFVDRTDVLTGPDRVLIRESDAGRVINQHFDFVQETGLEGRGFFMMGNLDQGEYAVGQIDSGSAFGGTKPDRTLSIPYVTGSAQWSALNRSGVSVPPTFPTYRVGVFESYTYFVDQDRVLQRLRADSTGATTQPVAINIGSLQVSLGVDTNNDGQVDNWMSAPTAAAVAGNRVIGMQVTILGRTNRMITDWWEPATTFQVADLDINDVDRSAKWRTIQIEAALRNYLF